MSEKYKNGHCVLCAMLENFKTKAVDPYRKWFASEYFVRDILAYKNPC
jgi:hypothetical protein